jgi:ribonuclease VapC
VIIDSSAVVALLKREPGSDALAVLIEEAQTCRISAGTLVELGIVADRAGLGRSADEFLSLVQPVIEPVTESQANIARLAYRQYGKGNEHPAKLNFGDCFAYALAREHNEPLLFTGDDFTHTDIRSALAT